MTDCLASYAPDVTFTISPNDPETQLFYARGGIPSVSATHTDDWGLGAFVNVPPGTVEVTATSLALGKVVSHATVRVEAQP
jgi:hypothetical protein